MSAPFDAIGSIRGKLYLYLSAIFLTALLIGDTIGAKLFELHITIAGVSLSAPFSVGAMWFPITFVLTDVINEFYGPKAARTVTFLGFWMAVLAWCAIWVARQIPAAPFSPTPQETFDLVFGNANRLFVASVIAYLIGQLADIAIFQRLKRVTGSRYIWLRATGSTLVSQAMDTVVVATLANYGLISLGQIVGLTLTGYVGKLLAALLLTPVIYAVHALLRRRFGLTAEPAAAPLPIEAAAIEPSSAG